MHAIMTRTLPADLPDVLQRCETFRAAGRIDAAFEVLVEALARCPECAELHFAMSGVLRDAGEPEQAIAACEAALRLRPDFAFAYNRLGFLHERAGRPLAALLAYDGAAAAAPRWHLPWHNQAALCLALGRHRRAEHALREALLREPGHAASHNALAQLLLADGRYDEGWRHYEWRFENEGAAPAHPGTTAPVWNGEALDGDVVMVWIEQGLGDHLQFARCVRVIAERGGRAWLQVPAPLYDLYASLADVERLIRQDEPVEGYDWQLPLLSLARIAGAPHGPEVAPVPYLHAPPLHDDARAVLSAHGDGARRIGIVWGSLPTHPAARIRDCDLRELARLADVDGVRLYSLQFGEPGRAIAGYPAIVDLGNVLGDFASTAAIVMALDLVVTVDTAMAHLAGALGKPVWLLVGEPADWRWQREREESPWYPTMRLFRQRVPGEWGEVIDRVAEALAEKN